MNSQNRLTIEINPVTSEPQLINDLEMGFTVRNVVKAPFYVLDGYTRMYPNMAVPEGITIEVRDGGELIIP
jgi:hypothetical protein